jgi:hypothetical protein
VLVRRLLVTLVLTLVVAPSASATMPAPYGRIAFADPQGGAYDLLSVGADGMFVRRLTWNYDVERTPVWSPDGRSIAYSRVPDTLLAYGRIWVMNADGTSQTQLTQAGDYIDDKTPSWSPDGTQIAFARSMFGGPPNLYIVNVDGTGLHRVSELVASQPKWSPSGTELAYVGADGLSVMSVDGSNARVVASGGATSPSWSPDGRLLAFSRGNPAAVFVVGADGSGLSQLTTDGRASTAPSWSPDGTQIVFQRAGDVFSQWALWVISSDGTSPHQIVSETFGEKAPDWGSSQLVPDEIPPDSPGIDIEFPRDGDLIQQGARAYYFCWSFVASITGCNGDIPSGSPINDLAGMHTLTVSALDRAGRTATKSVTYQVLDLKPPYVELRNPPLNTLSLYNVGDVVLADYSCSDPDSPTISCTANIPSGSPIDTTHEGYGSLTVHAVDPIGHSYHAQSSWYVVGPPRIVVTTPADGASYLVGSNQTVSFGCSNGIYLVTVTRCEGTVANGVALDTSAVGLHSFTVDAANDRGLASTSTSTYRVAYDFSGFDTPVDATGAIADAKAGEPVPLKFSLSGDRGLGVVTSVTWRTASCADWTTGPAAAAGGQLSYAPSSTRYTEAVATAKSWKGSCRILNLEFADGTQHAVRVSFTH